MSLRPRTTACLPAISTPVFSSKIMTPAGVQGEYSGVEAREDNSPMLYAWKLGVENQFLP